MADSEDFDLIGAVVDVFDDLVGPQATKVAVLKSLELFHAIRSGRVFE